MSEPWVINASPVILLAKVGLIERVPLLAEPFVVPQPVSEEILRARADDAAARWMKRAGLINEVKPVLLHIKRVGGYIGDELLREAIRSAGEKP